MFVTAGRNGQFGKRFPGRLPPSSLAAAGNVASAFFHYFGQNYGLVMFFIFRAKKKRQRSMLLLHLFQFREQFLFLLQLRSVFLLKFRPLFPFLPNPFTPPIPRPTSLLPR